MPELKKALEEGITGNSKFSMGIRVISSTGRLGSILRPRQNPITGEWEMVEENR
jgi:hypothetical protein